MDLKIGHGDMLIFEIHNSLLMWFEEINETKSILLSSYHESPIIKLHDDM